VIYGGKITATGGKEAAGIGGGYGGDRGTVQIYGGQVTATGGDGGAGIGGGDGGAGETIAIYGGRVKATGGEKAAGIGGGRSKGGGTILINGGYVTATSDDSSDGIGKGYSAQDSSFSTGANGSAVIVTNSISDQNNRDNWNGVIFQDGTGTVYGDTVELNADAEIPADMVLTVPEDAKLVIPSGVTLTCNGTLENKGKIENNGTVQLNNAQTPETLGKLTGSGEVITADGTHYRYSNGWSVVDADNGDTLLSLLVCGGLLVWTVVGIYHFYDPAAQQATAA
jgi:hypothetical protein